ncbi:DUF3558 domain-containing protein [Nocardia puris]|uniref:Uncharacterized protein DUF3558 n=1 Tax=Nocardia puris TaxID=208602 RepID=A0A366DL88_9NOCA|nr:DUF3558 domain-containing protein [Nocardia puris]MBF6211481.1 DUF3558 domain-containing protein [Nocardia puris]MBF6369542.1 DUF3558 domain-containing protein [Nocardia puris]MBF6458983.1 DUF3558 domain-containing protein [Nocardia puris]RBO90842.1 uncharacterized protein DUF3558 [Nocardia puris]
MRIPAALVIGVAVVGVVTACGSSGDGSSGDVPLRPPPKVATLGPFVGECGNVTDDEVREIAGLQQLTTVFKNSVGCNYQSGGLVSPSVTFASYRGSPIERERAWVASVGREPDKIEVSGHSGFMALSPGGQVCDLAVQLEDDFFEWSMSYGIYEPTGNACDKMRRLAELTVERLG